MRKKIDCRKVDDSDLDNKYCSVAAAVVGSAVVGGVMNSKSASKAADAQTAAANQANETQRYMYDTTRADQAPFLQTGTAANQKLAYLLGIGGSQGGDQGGAQSYKAISADNLIDTSGGDWRPNADLYQSSPEYRAAWDNFSKAHQSQFGVSPNYSRGSNLGSAEDYITSQFDLNAYNQAQQEKSAAAQTVQANDPSYGSLLRSFSAEDLANDPIYQSTYQNALDTGTKAANQQASATGSLLSGNTLKALTRFGANTAATYGNDAYNRYNTNQSNVFNRLSGVSGTGQQSAGQVAASGQNYANNVSANQIGLGNARGASAIAQGNALTGALNTGVNAYAQNQYMNSLSPYAQQAPAPVTDLSF
jgi:hypothetical protein